jgi:prepilin-type N-terminal cleavage/methylation domain-containing protein
MKMNSGYTLIEMTMSVALMSIVSLLTFVALQSTTQSSNLNGAKEQIAADLRQTMLAVTGEVRQAYTARTVGADPPIAPEEAFEITVINGGKGVRFCVPEPVDGSVHPVPSDPIVIEFQNEDVQGGANALLDGSEDTNGDGVLTRRLVRRVGETIEVIGASNNISNVVFTLEANSSDANNILNTLVVQLQGSKKQGLGDDLFLVSSAMESRIALEN